MTRIAVFLLGTVLLMPAAALADREKAPDGARAYIIWPHDGAVIPGGKFWVRMGLQNMGLTPAGIRKPDAGHHHLLIDTEVKDLNEPIPNNKQNLHFGAGQTEARLELPPGRHTIQMVLGDTDHVPHDPPVVSQKITVIVP
ncbi:DUF4399 domain-containing protein [Azospirillum sp. TSO22-1]|uniref:DUF4399 domain-containing protein n=1 Tax=Azospirillum sp. TSO22-1 TaxID=716789 RepID=UPI000D64B517|nr:DUF4399 domain-containing protein [Azospirillum sp. TSO22-1]